MKEILGSPIGLGEVNLTVDNRVRRCIKEYFGDVTKPEDVTKWALYVNVDEKKYKNSPEDALSKESQFSVTGMYSKKNEYDALDLVGRYFKVESLSETLYIKIESNPTGGSDQFRSKTMLVNKDVIKEIEEKTTKLIKATEEDPSLLFVNLIKKEDEDKEQLENYFKSEDEKLNTFRGIGFPFDAIITLAESNDSKKKLKIGVKAPERFLRKIFRIIINGVKIYFLPITKVGNKLEGDPVVIADNDWGKIKDSLTSQNTQAYLPATDEEKLEFKSWWDGEVAKAKAADIQAEKDEDDKFIENAKKGRCESNICKTWDNGCYDKYDKEGDDNNCDDSFYGGCCVSANCKRKKYLKWSKKNKAGSILAAICSIIVSLVLIIWIVYVRYKKDYSMVKKGAWYFMLFVVLCISVYISYAYIDTTISIDNENYPVEWNDNCGVLRIKAACEQDLNKYWDNDKNVCKDRCNNGRFWNNSKGECECPEGETYRKYGSSYLNKKKCVEDCRLGTTYCRKKGKCVTAGMCL